MKEARMCGLELIVKKATGTFGQWEVVLAIPTPWPAGLGSKTIRYVSLPCSRKFLSFPRKRDAQRIAAWYHDAFFQEGLHVPIRYMHSYSYG